MSGLLLVRVTPRSARPGIGGWRKGADGKAELQVRVAAAPADGAANEEVRQRIARALDLPQSQVRIVSGETSRHKRIAVPLTNEDVRRLLP